MSNIKFIITEFPITNTKLSKEIIDEYMGYNARRAKDSERKTKELK